MKQMLFYVSVALSMLLAEAWEALSRGFSSLSALVKRVFLPSKDTSPWGKRGAHFTRKRLRYLGRIARVEITAARDLGASAKEFLRTGHPLVARRAARGAYMHWRNARKAFARFTAVA
jgi:hypothetical protein